MKSRKICLTSRGSAVRSRQLPQRSPIGGLFCFVVLSEICIQWVAIPCLPAGRDPVNSHRGHQLVAFFVKTTDSFLFGSSFLVCYNRNISNFHTLRRINQQCRIKCHQFAHCRRSHIIPVNRPFCMNPFNERL